MNTQGNLNLGRIGSRKIALPPLHEQATISKHLDKATADIDAAMDHTRRQIDLVQEYRTRLIADVVTGKLDIREAAEQLPDEDGNKDLIEELGPLANGLPADLYDTEEAAEDSILEREVTA